MSSKELSKKKDSPSASLSSTKIKQVKTHKSSNNITSKSSPKTSVSNKSKESSSSSKPEVKKEKSNEQHTNGKDVKKVKSEPKEVSTPSTAKKSSSKATPKTPTSSSKSKTLAGSTKQESSLWATKLSTGTLSYSMSTSSVKQEPKSEPKTVGLQQMTSSSKKRAAVEADVSKYESPTKRNKKDEKNEVETKTKVVLNIEGSDDFYVMLLNVDPRDLRLNKRLKEKIAIYHPGNFIYFVESKMENKLEKFVIYDEMLIPTINGTAHLFLSPIVSKDNREKLDLYGILNLVPGVIEMLKKQKKPGITCSKAAQSPPDIEIKLEKWPNFEKEFKLFNKEIYKISKLKNARIYDKPRIWMNSIVDSEQNVRQNHVNFLNLVFTQIYEDINMFFNNADNTDQKIKSDVYWSTISARKNHMNDFFAEIKRELDLVLPPCDNLLKLYQDKDEKITKAISQIYSYTKLLRNQNKDISDRYVYSILSNHQYTYCFRLDGDTLYISERIGLDKQFMGYFFIMMLRYPQFTPNGFEKIQDFIKIVHEKFSQQSKITTKTSQVTTKAYAKKSKGNKQQQLKNELFNIWLDDSEVFYSNDNNVLSSFLRDGKKYAMKCCDMENSDEEAINEIRNEIEILEHLNQTGKSNPEIFPKSLFVGSVCIYWMVVTEFINGTCYDDFNQMKESEKKTCLYSLKQLHTLKIRHGDVRAPNFIIKKSSHSTDPVAVIIDFGRSQKETSNQSLKEEYDQLYRDLNSISNESKGSIGPSNDSNNFDELSTQLPPAKRRRRSID